MASVTYPDVYESFLQYIDFANLDLGWVLSAGCLIETDFYENLVVMTLAPLGTVIIVVISYAVSTRGKTFGDDHDTVVQSRNRHASVLFWVSFLVYSTTSSAAFQIFACDTLESGRSYLRADHRLECYTPTHRVFQIYAALMIAVYPFGIPLCYSLVLYWNRDALKTTSQEAVADAMFFKDLWQPYRSQVFYYEVIECFRRVLLAGIVVFILPNTAGQVATSFLIALVFFSVLILLNPYENPSDTWLSRIGHAVVMMSMFVALLLKVDESHDDTFSQDVFGVALVAANCVMILVVAAEACGMFVVAFQEAHFPFFGQEANSVIDDTVEQRPHWATAASHRTTRQIFPQEIVEGIQEARSQSFHTPRSSITPV